MSPSYPLLSQNDSILPELNNLIQDKTLHSRCKELMLKYQFIVNKQIGIETLGGLEFHPSYPFFTLFHMISHQAVSKFSKNFALLSMVIIGILSNWNLF